MTQPSAAPARRAVVGPRPPGDRRPGPHAARGAGRAGLRHPARRARRGVRGRASPSAPTSSTSARMIAQGPPPRCSQSDVVRQPTSATWRRRRDAPSSSCGTCRPATGRSAPCSTCRSPSSRARRWPSSGRTASARPPSPGSPPGWSPRRSGAVLVDGADLTGGRAAPLRAGRASLHAPEGRSVFATLTVEENLSLSFRRVAGPRRGAGRARPRLRAVPGARPTAAASWPAPCRAASSGCCRWPGCWSRSRSCWWPTSCRSAWRRSSSTRSTPASTACAATGTVAAHRRAARRPRPGAVRPGRAARPRRRHVGGLAGRRRRARGHRGVRARLTAISDADGRPR